MHISKAFEKLSFAIKLMKTCAVTPHQNSGNLHNLIVYNISENSIPQLKLLDLQ